MSDLRYNISAEEREQARIANMLRDFDPHPVGIGEGILCYKAGMNRLERALIAMSERTLNELNKHAPFQCDDESHDHTMCAECKVSWPCEFWTTVMSNDIAINVVAVEVIPNER